MRQCGNAGLGGGSITVRAKTHMETISLGGGRHQRNAIMVTELPTKPARCLVQAPKVNLTSVLCDLTENIKA